MSESDGEREPVTVEITVDAGSLVAGLQRAQAATLFAFHPDLGDLNGSLDNLYGDNFEG
ncbi:hypothetical protein [Streptomyces sp. NPDC057257]|uniref:hypothetical protein n=1 Tax=Streptomyces sp. NPDC057257 TaxID=3346071 RepID=UPI00363558E1